MRAKLLISLLLLAAACTTDKTMTDGQKAVVMDEGTAVVKEMFDALAASESEKMVSLCENSADFIFVFGGEVHNYQSMTDIIREMLPQVDKQTFNTKHENYVIVNPACFIYTWHGRNGVYMKSGDISVEEDYLGTYAFRKNDDGWKLFAGHESARCPVPADTSAVL